MPTAEMTITVNADDAIEKLNQLIELLSEIDRLIGSISEKAKNLSAFLNIQQ